MKKMLSFFTTVVLLVIMVASMGIVGYGYTKRYECFNNQHVISGNSNVSYETITPTRLQTTTLEMDCNSIISTGRFIMGLRVVDSTGAVTSDACDLKVIHVNSTSQELDGNYTSQVYSTKTHKAFIYGHDGIHFIINKVYVHYD